MALNSLTSYRWQIYMSTNSNFGWSVHPECVTNIQIEKDSSLPLGMTTTV
jgi:hypothetical protein